MNKLLVIFLILFFYTPLLAGSNIYCNPGNTGTENGETEETGYKTLHTALSEMSSGDTVVISNGDWRNTSGMYIDADHRPPDGTSGSYSRVIAETDWGVKLPYIRIETVSSVTQGYLEFRGIVFDNKYIGSGSGHVSYHMHHTKFIRCGFLANGLTGNAHTTGFGNADSDRSKNQYNLMEECTAWGSGRYVFYSKYGQYNIFRRCVARHDYNDDPQISNFRAYACDYHIYQNCISIDSDRTQHYASPLNDESAGFWIGDQYGATGNQIIGSISVKDIHMPYYIASNESGSADISNSIALDVTVVGYDTLSAFILKSNINVTASNILGFGATLEGQDGFYGKNSGTFTIKNSILKDIADVGVSGVTNTYINHYNAGSGTFGTGATTYDPFTNGLLYPVRIEAGSNLATAGEDSSICGPTILKKIGTSGTIYGETGWNTATNDDLWPFPNEDTIKTLMSTTVDGVTGSYGFCTGNSLDSTPQTLTKYIWEYLGNQIPGSVYAAQTNRSGTGSGTGNIR